ncbi:MAG: hypothetical protein MZV64_04790 [Ignavibacteriales bacterium]|nr:hypothetical protein [Ignavibacteriales bacterium]
MKRLQLVAQVFTNALARRRHELALQESEARLSLAADSAEAGLWTLDYRDGHLLGDRTDSGDLRLRAGRGHHPEALPGVGPSRRLGSRPGCRRAVRTCRANPSTSSTG